MHRGEDEHRVKKRSFAFTLAYIKCFRTYSLYLSLRLPAQILYAGIHLCPLAVLRSCFGYSLSHLRTAAACLSRCIRHRRRSKAKPLRGRQGRFRAVHRFNAALISAFRTSSFTMSYEHNHRRNQWYRKGCREHHEQFSAAEGDCLEHRLQRRNIHRAQNYRRGRKRRQN